MREADSAVQSHTKMSDTIESKEDGPKGAHVDVHNSDVLTNKDLMNDAFDGENQEHELGVWEAVKSHPWACLWAFTMCFTIVSCSSLPRFSIPASSQQYSFSVWTPSGDPGKLTPLQLGHGIIRYVLE